MFYKIPNRKGLSPEQLRADALMRAYFIIKNYPLKASDIPLESYFQQLYNISLKDMCIKLLLSLVFYRNTSGDIILLFKDPKYDKIARLITYGNGALPGSKILQSALMN